ncbi:MAG: DUF4954 family protein, partial [bacterium]
TTIGDNILVKNIGTFIRNYKIEDDTAVINTGTLHASKDASFGHGVRVEVINEGGGREVALTHTLSSQTAFIMAMYRSNPVLVKRLEEIIEKDTELVMGKGGIIGKGSRIINCGRIKDVYIGGYSLLEQVTRLENGYISSSADDPVFVGSGVNAENFIFLSGSSVDSGSLLSKVFVGQGCRIGKQFSAENSLFFANCEGFHGEAVSIFAGPYSVSHHKSTLLIAFQYSFYNAGSATNASNHMYKLGPVHQGILERGCKTGSFSYLLLESHLAPFSVVIGKHHSNIDVSKFPFSYLTEIKGETYITPAMNLFTVGTKRDGEKWILRDRRKDSDKRDIIMPQVFSPFTVERMRCARDSLAVLFNTTPREVKYVNIGGAKLSRLLIKNSRRYYELGISFYITTSLVNKLAGILEESDDIIAIEKVFPSTTDGETEWLDLSGMLVPRLLVEKLINDILDGRIDSMNSILESLRNTAGQYPELEWAYILQIIKDDYNTDFNSWPNVLKFLDGYSGNAAKFYNMIISDAHKEFEDFARIGYGLDGLPRQIEADFEAVRGTVDNNKTIIKLKAEAREFDDKVKKIINKLKTF